jgi:hypothetical protein
LRQSFSERRYQALGFHIIFGKIHKHADAPYPGGLLRTRRKRIRDSRTAD